MSWLQPNLPQHLPGCAAALPAVQPAAVGCAAACLDRSACAVSLTEQVEQPEWQEGRHTMAKRHQASFSGLPHGRHHVHRRSSAHAECAQLQQRRLPGGAVPVHPVSLPACTQQCSHTRVCHWSNGACGQIWTGGGGLTHVPHTLFLFPPVLVDPRLPASPVAALAVPSGSRMQWMLSH